MIFELTRADLIILICLIILFLIGAWLLGGITWYGCYKSSNNFRKWIDDEENIILPVISPEGIQINNEISIERAEGQEI